MDKISKIASEYEGIISKISNFAIWINAALGLWAGAMVGIGLQDYLHRSNRGICSE